jgi:8-oxo-dGTP diphosphatase
MNDLLDMRYCSYCGGILEQRIAHGRERPVCTDCGRVHFQDPKVAVIVFAVSGRKVLLVKRGIVPEQGRWTLPGGYVDAGEDPRKTAVRECREETGLRVKITALVDVRFTEEHPGGASILIIFGGEVVGGELSASDDAWDAGLFPPEELPPLGFDLTRELVVTWAEERAG